MRNVAHGTGTQDAVAATATAAATPAKPSWLAARPVRRLVACQLVLALVIAVTTGLLVWHLRETVLAEARHELRSTSLLLAEQAERSFEAVNLLQTAILDRLHSAAIQTPEEFRQHATGDAIQDELREWASALPQIEAVTLIDTNGTVINWSRVLPVSPLSIADRDYFKHLKDDPERTTLISMPLENRGSGTWSIFLARKIFGADHVFIGIVLAAIPLRYFEQLYRQVASGPAYAISMFRNDGVLLARYPHSDRQIGLNFGPSLAFTQEDANSPDTLVVRKISEVDHRDRLIAARSLDHFPLVINTTDTVAAILAEWWKQAVYLIGAGIILELVAAAACVLMLRQLHSQRMLHDALSATAAAKAELLGANERERTDREMRTQNVRFEAAVSNMSQALCLFDTDNRLVVANLRLAEMFGRPATSIMPNMTIAELGLTTELSDLRTDGEDTTGDSIDQLRAANLPASRVRALDDGRTLAVHFVPVEDSGWLMTLEDISERQRIQAKMMHMAHHDALTLLPNRVFFHLKLTEAVARSRRGLGCAVLLLDLDQFKAVNDTLGHPVGDALLRAVTRRLQNELRETDTVARLGGDEFAIVQSSVDQPENATALAGRLIEALSMPYEIDAHPLIIGVSIGIAVVPADGTDPDEIIKHADLALYRAKSEGRARYRFFEPAMDATMQARRALEMDLRKGLIGGEFVLYYQPLVNVASRSIIGLEALMRWFHPQRGLVQPSDFIPLAEAIGLLVPLGAWALRRACFDAAGWPDDIKVSVNVSVTQFASRTLVEDVASALRDSGLAASRLELEITETVMLEDTQEVIRILHELRDLGVGIALDDFGTGYSSLSYLRRFPFTKVKIDRCFTSGLGKRGDSEAIVISVIDLCDMLGMTVLAEGVETEDQLQRLRERRCGEAQGYLFSRPRPLADVPELCRSLQRQAAAEVVLQR